MPQFELAWFPGQIFWMTACFCVLYWAVSRFFLPPVERIVNERTQKIQAVLRQADELNACADRLRQAHEAYVNKAQEQSARMIQKMHEDIAADHALQEQHFLNVLKSSSARAEKEVSAKQTETHLHLKEITSQFVDIVFRTVYRVRPRKSAVNNAVNAHLKEFSE